MYNIELQRLPRLGSSLLDKAARTGMSVHVPRYVGARHGRSALGSLDRLFLDLQDLSLLDFGTGVVG
jgi:hypothetical protein